MQLGTLCDKPWVWHEKFLRNRHACQKSAPSSSMAVPLRGKFMHEAEIVADKTDTDIYLRWSDDDFASYSPWRQINLRDKRARTRRLGRTSRRTFELKHLDNKPLRLEALELTIGD